MKSLVLSQAVSATSANCWAPWRVTSQACSAAEETAPAKFSAPYLTDSMTPLEPALDELWPSRSPDWRALFPKRGLLTAAMMHLFLVRQKLEKHSTDH